MSFRIVSREIKLGFSLDLVLEKSFGLTCVIYQCRYQNVESQHYVRYYRKSKMYTRRNWWKSTFRKSAINLFFQSGMKSRLIEGKVHKSILKYDKLTLNLKTVSKNYKLKRAKILQRNQFEEFANLIWNNSHNLYYNLYEISLILKNS